MAYKLKYYAQLERATTYRLEIHEDGFTGSAKRIFTLQSLAVGYSGNADITSAIVKSQLNFSVIEAPDLAKAGTFAGPWGELYTSDSTKYLVMLKEGNEVRWSGYLTPDSYAENLVYHSAISFVARDMLGNASNFAYDSLGDENGMVTPREVITAAFAASRSPMILSWTNVDGKLTENGTDVLDLKLNAAAFAGKNWYDALEMVLESLGMQARWTDGNTISLLYLRDYSTVLPDTKPVQWVNCSGYREIDPSVKEIVQTDDYHGNAYLFDGMMRPEDFELVDGVWKLTSRSGWQYDGEMKVGNQFASTDTDLSQVQNRIYLSVKNNPPAKHAAGVAKRIKVHPTGEAVRVSFSLSSIVYKNGANGLTADSYTAGKKHKTMLNYFIIAMVNGVPQYLTLANEWSDTPYTPGMLATMEVEATSGADAQAEWTFFLPPEADELIVWLSDVLYYEYKTMQYFIAQEGEFYGRVDNLSVSLANGGTYNNFVTTTKLSSGNVILNRKPDIVQAPAVVSPKIITNGIYRADGTAAYAFKWADESDGGRLSVALAKQMLSMYAEPRNLLSGTFRAKDGSEPRFDVHYDYDVYGSFVLTRGMFNVITGFLENVSMRQIVPYTSLGITSTSEVGKGGGSVYSSNAGGGGGSIGGGGGSSALSSLFVPHYNDSGELESIEATAGLWTNSFISAGGLNDAGGGSGDIPIASADTLGGIKVGDNLTITEDGTLSATGGGGVTQGYVDAHLAGISIDDGFPNNGQVLTYDQVQQRWVYSDAGTSAQSLLFDESTNSWGKGRIIVANTNDATKYGYKTKAIAPDYTITAASTGFPTSSAVYKLFQSGGGGGGGVSQTYVDTHLAGKTISTSKPTTGQVVYWTGSQFAYKTVTGGGTSGITQDEADARYLQKTSADTATAKETFTKGIRIGSAAAGIDITYDASAQALKVDGNLYAMQAITAGGSATDGNAELNAAIDALEARIAQLEARIAQLEGNG